MYAFVSNEYRGIVHSRQNVYILTKVYSFPIVQYCRTEQEALDFIQRHPRQVFESDIYKKAGWVKSTSYIRAEYFISDENIYVNLYTDKFGFIKLNLDNKDNVIQDAQYDRIKVKIKNVCVRDESIISNCIAVNNIISLFDDIVNLQIIVPDISVYLALTAYTGNNSTIKRIQNKLEERIGKVALLLR